MKIKKLSLVFLAAVLAITTVFFKSDNYNIGTDAASLSENKETVRNLESDLKGIQSSLAQIQKNIENAKQNQKDQIYIKNQLDQEITLAEAEIETLSLLIDGYNLQIDEKTAEIENKDANIRETLQIISDRLVMQHENGNSNIISYILGSSDFADLLTRVEITNALFEYDKMLIETLTNDKIELGILKDELTATRDKCDESIKALEEKKIELNGKIATAESYLKEYMKDEKRLQEEYNTKSAELDSIASEIKDLLAQIELQERTNYSGEEFRFPLSYDSYYYISSRFGWRTWGDGSREYHKGLDLAAYRGTPVIATNSGTVILRRNSPSFGLYLIVDHGGGITSLYAHCSKLLVNVGDQVTRGDKIAEVGSTGWSTGNHLHFSILENGEYVDPLGYITVP